MAKILILDDDQDYCEELSLALSRDGHDVLTASNGSDAIGLGSLFRPDVLVTDWMLGEHSDGLAVAEVLELVAPSMQVILITGFASADLRNNAKYQEVFAFIEKPFQLGEIRRTVNAALEQVKPAEHVIPIGVVEVDATGALIFFNRYAEELFKTDSAVKKHLNDVLEFTEQTPLSELNKSWISCKSKGYAQKLYARARGFDEVDSLLIAILCEEHASYMYDPLVYRLLNCRPLRPKELNVEGHLLIIDSYEQTRRVAAELLREYSCVCHTAQTHAEGWRLFERDTEIRHVILNFEMTRTKPLDFIKKLKKHRPETRIIAAGGYGDLAEYREFGVEDFLPSPWSDEDLIRLVGTRAGTSGFAN